MAAETVFADVPAWPGEGSGERLSSGRDAKFDNQPPLEERVMLEFEEALDREGIKARIEQLLESAGKCPATIGDEATVGKVGDFIRLARDVEKRVNDAREKHNRPLLNAQRSLKAKADSIMQPLLSAGGDLRSRLNAYVAKKEREAAEEQRRQEEEARKAREALEEAGVDEKIVEQVSAPAPAPRTPIARGDLGSTVSARSVWKFEREAPVAKLPKSILEHPKVLEAIDQVIGSLVRSGTREIKGVRIFEDKEASVR